MITSIDSFRGLLQIAADKNTEFLEFTIEQLEERLLKKWFGYALYKKIIAETPEAVITTLLDGAEYTDEKGKTQYLTGLKKTLPYFMYFYIVRDQQTQNTENGEVDVTFENAIASDPTPKLVQNYNQGVKFINEIFEYIEYKEDDYPDADLCNYLDYITRFF